MNSLVATVFSGILYLLFWPSEKDQLNAQMAELCAKDGGVKVYETVKLSAEIFDKYGSLKNRKLVKNNGRYDLYIDDRYILFDEEVVLKDGDRNKNEGRLYILHSIARRISDNKIMGESFVYHRAGGERWYPGMPGGDYCPKDIDLFKSVFIANKLVQGDMK